MLEINSTSDVADIKYGISNFYQKQQVITSPWALHLATGSVKINQSISMVFVRSPCSMKCPGESYNN